ncbi:hypothetical protein AB2N04_17505 [Nitratireductor sp. GISD-1A_MAKvit]|uniref:hypothetical protein n=1 Tax=Nitratireductor sp. GISD-1A_MAKvit TaxID=3234198 RepID=UPI00346703C5
MPAKPLIDVPSISVLIDEMVKQGYSSAEIDIILVRQGPVDLDLVQECKLKHSALQNASRGRQRRFRLRF